MAKRWPHRTPSTEANKMIASYLSIRDYVYQKLKDDSHPDAERAKEYFSCGILSFAFYKGEWDKYFKELLDKTPLNSEPPEEFGFRMYLAADADTGRPTLVVTLCKVIGIDSDVENVSSSATARDVLEHPRLASGSGNVDAGGPDSRPLLPEN